MKKKQEKNNTTNGDEYGKDEMKDHIYGLAKEHEIRFGLERYRGLYFVMCLLMVKPNLTTY